MFRASQLVALAFAAVVSSTVPATRAAVPTIAWDQATQRHLADGGYPRLIRANEKTLLLSCDFGGQSIVRRSLDDGVTWSAPIVAATFDHGACANAQPLQLADGRLQLFYNERPSDGVHPFTIRVTESRDAGRSWKVHPDPLYVADTKFDNGCWEPAAIQLPTSDVVVFFANESPYRRSSEQEITFLRSTDRGRTWSSPGQFSFRAHGRDGMPVPLVLRDGSLVVSIEDDGLTGDHRLQPAILSADVGAASFKPVAGADPRRWAAIDDLPATVYAGAPFIAQLPTGETVLSCQNDDAGHQPEMTVYLGDAHARHFARPSHPFDLPANVSAKWGSLFVLDKDTILALTTTRIDHRTGIWSIMGHIHRESR